MYRRYTQIFRIFGAMIILLQISKNSALFKIRKYQNTLFSLSRSLTAGPHMSSLSSDIDRGIDGANSPPVSPTATAKLPTRSQDLGASICGTLEVNYDMEQG